MNYSRNIKKASIGKRVLISWAVVAIIFSLVGFGIGAICSGNDSPEQSEPDTQKEVLIFGQPDGRIFEGEMPGEWMNGERKFVPLNVPMDEDLQEFIFYLSQAYEMDFTFVMALIQQESEYKPDAISRTNDYGLMQINQKNHEWLSNAVGVTDFLDPYQNIQAGIYILGTLFEKYDDPRKVLMAYNMGESGASKLWDQGIYQSKYSQRVIGYQEIYIKELNGNDQM